jgi:hypothetical protein
MIGHLVLDVGWSRGSTAFGRIAAASGYFALGTTTLIAPGTILI